MTNEEKAEEICKRHIFDSNHFDCCMEMAKWKEQEMIKKACEWWENELTCPTMSQVETSWMQTKIVEFRKAMEE